MIRSMLASGVVILLGLPVLAVSAMGECLPAGDEAVADCLAGKRIEFLALTFGLISLAAVVGWLTYRNQSQKRTGN
jgi:hypothetical protein